MFIQKITDQCRYSAMAPPSAGPSAPARGVDHREIAVVLAALLGRGDVAQHHHAGRGQSAAAEPVQHAAEDQHDHVGRERADQRAQHVERDRDQQRDAAAVGVADLAVQRGDRGVGDQIGGDQPGQVVHVAELAADGRQRARQDRGVERAHEHRQQHAEHHEHGLAVGQGSLADGGPGIHTRCSSHAVFRDGAVTGLDSIPSPRMRWKASCVAALHACSPSPAGSPARSCTASPASGCRGCRSRAAHRRWR